MAWNHYGAPSLPADKDPSNPYWHLAIIDVFGEYSICSDFSVVLICNFT
jgi:hypothetical protein